MRYGIMERFSKTLRGYSPVEVNKFIDDIILKVEKIIKLSKQKDDRIKKLEYQLSEYAKVSDRLSRYQNMDDTLRNGILLAQKTSEQIKLNAIKESELILDQAKQNANRIVNDALLRAEAIEKDIETLKRNKAILKRQMREELQSQLSMLDDVEKIDI